MNTRRYLTGALLLVAACGGRAADQPKAPPHAGAHAQSPPQLEYAQPRPGLSPNLQPLPAQPSPNAQPGLPVPGPPPMPQPFTPSFANAEEAERAVEADERELLSTLEDDAFQAAQVSQCTTACRALASMRRSVEGLCGMTGDSDARCTSARSRLARAGDRVREAGCTCTQP